MEDCLMRNDKFGTPTLLPKLAQVRNVGRGETVDGCH
jgi:hypothetical protein